MSAIAGIVSVHEVRVGQLDRMGDDEDHIFTYDEAWLDDPERPTLGQLFEDRRPDPVITSGIPCWFAHLLPQGPWARHLRRWAALDDEASDLEVLLAIGADLPGAVTLAPAVPRLFGTGGYAKPREVEGSALTFSLAGAQWKLSVHDGERGLVVPVVGEGPGHYIAKFHDASFPGLPRVEHATTAWAARAGLTVHDARLVRVEAFEALPKGVPTGDGTVFLASRFDRLGQHRVHVEDFGQIIDRPPGDPGQYTGSYEELLTLLAVLAPEDVEEALRRIAFVVVCGNSDAHLKNWGVVYPDRRNPRLSPAYDLVATVVYPRLQRRLALSLGGRHDFAALDLTCTRSLAEAAQWEEVEVARILGDGIDRALDAWQRARGEGWTDEEVASIDHHIASVPLLRR